MSPSRPHRPPSKGDGDSEHSSENIPAADMINPEFIYAHFLNTRMPSPPAPLPWGFRGGQGKRKLIDTLKI